jgi:GDP-L-fucose synthase
MAAASIYVMQLDAATYQAHTQPMQSHINVGTGEDLSIAELAQQVATVVGYQGRIDFDTSKPDGPPRKLMNVQRLTQLGWQASTPLAAGIQLAYQDFLTNHAQLRG